MKRTVLLIAVLFAAAAAAWSVEQTGLGAEILLDSEVIKGPTPTSESTFILEPMVALKLSEKVEVDPFIRLYFNTVKTGSTITSQITQFGAGAALRYHLLKTPVFSLGTGAAARFGLNFYPEPATPKQSGFYIAAQMPLFADMNLGEHVTFRFNWNVVRLSLVYTKTDTTPVTKQTNFYIDTELNDLSAISIGFVYWL